MKTLTLAVSLLALAATIPLSAQTHSWSHSYSSSSSSSSGWDGNSLGSDSRATRFPPGFPPAFGGSAFGGSGFPPPGFSARNQAFSASFQNSPAQDVVRQLANWSQTDPQLSKAALRRLESAAPVTRQFNHATPGGALDEVLAELDLKLVKTGDRTLLLTTGERQGSAELAESTLGGLGLESQLRSPFPLLAWQTPLRMFLQSASLQLGVELEVDYRQLKVDPQTPVNIQPFSSSTLGESLQIGLASAGLEYRVADGKLVISRQAD